MLRMPHHKHEEYKIAEIRPFPKWLEIVSQKQAKIHLMIILWNLSQ